MKKTISAFLLTISIVLSPTASALSKSDKACGAILCLSGIGGSACLPYLNPYFAITSFTGGGWFSSAKFNGGSTKRARRKWLGNCNKVEPEIIDQANSKYGTSKNQPRILTD
ncbi:MAG: TrbM/KikA/MpfK family conjugal transfer protein [Sedimenticola sp.]